ARRAGGTAPRAGRSGDERSARRPPKGSARSRGVQRDGVARYGVRRAWIAGVQRVTAERAHAVEGRAEGIADEGSGGRYRSSLLRCGWEAGADVARRTDPRHHG